MSGQDLGVALRDLMLRRKFEVRERRGSRDLRTGAIVCARVVSLDGDSIILGCVPVVMPSTRAGPLIDIRDSWGIEAGDAVALASRDAASRAACFGLLGRVLNPPPPGLNNADGDPPRFITLRYELQCSPQEASDALAPLARGLGGDRPSRTDDAGRLVSVALPWIEEGVATPEYSPGKTLGRPGLRLDGGPPAPDPRAKPKLNPPRNPRASVESPGSTVIPYLAHRRVAQPG